MISKATQVYQRVFVLAALFMVSTQAQADAIAQMKQALEQGWFSNLITAGLLIWALLEGMGKVKEILSGESVFKHVFVIASLLALAFFWKDIANGVLNIAGGIN